MQNWRKQENGQKRWVTGWIGFLLCLIIGGFALASHTSLLADDTMGSASQLPVVYVDRQSKSVSEDGTQAHPFKTVAQGVTAVDNSGKIIIQANRYGDILTIERPLTLETVGGVTTIGVPVATIYRIYLPLTPSVAIFTP